MSTGLQPRRLTLVFPLAEPVRLVALSCLMLFVELALIRWAGANVVYVRYFTNFVLLSSFLGIGVGFLRAKAESDRFRLAPAVLLALVLFVSLFPVQQGRSGDLPVLRGLFGTWPLPPWVALPAIFALVTAAMACIGEGVARSFSTFDSLRAYRLDVGGSILGVVGFTLVSFLGTRPVVWGVVITLLFVLVMERPIPLRQWAALGGIVLLLGLNSLSPLDRWSPYYKVSVSEADDGRTAIRVNGLPHQSMLSLDRLLRDQPFYGYPYTHLRGRSLDDVLIIGAGTGNDVAVALSRGAKRVDAVEIDPVLLELGGERHPERPYQDPRVTAYVNDGRALLERTEKRYDLIEFALPDSLTLVSGQGSLRLESYLFTREAFESVRDHLKGGGAFSMYNYYRPDVFNRFAATLTEVFGHPPCLDKGEPGDGIRRQFVLTTSRDPGAIDCATLWSAPRTVPAPATDDHPFPYVSGRMIPTFYVVTLLLILLASIVVVRRASGRPIRAMHPYADLVLMGAAFLLLETKNVVQFALLFGTTWLVNSLVFVGILLAVYLAIEIARRFRLPRPSLLYALLLASLAVAWAVPPGALLDLALVPRFLAAVALAFGPVFLANLVFSQRFKDVGTSTVAFGANLLGAMVGGLLEYAAITVGYRNLLIVVAALYAGAYALERRASRPGGVEHAELEAVRPT